MGEAKIKLPILNCVGVQLKVGPELGQAGEGASVGSGVTAAIAATTATQAASYFDMALIATAASSVVADAL